MKIDSVKKIVETNYYVDVSDSDWQSYRRSESGNWEVLMGESWEPVYIPQYMEMQFQEFLKSKELNNEFFKQ